MAKHRKSKRQTTHAYQRMHERYGSQSAKEVEDFARGASKRGMPVTEFPEGTELRRFLDMKTLGRKRVKVYRGMVVILNKTSDRMITAYKLPDKYLEEYERAKKIYIRKYEYLKGRNI